MGFVEKTNLFLKDFVNAQFCEISFKRGFGIIEPFFKLMFKKDDLKFEFEVETDFRIRDHIKTLLNFNDLYIDNKSKSLSIKKFRRQKDIEQSLLFQELQDISSKYCGSAVQSFDMLEYGDLNITLDSGVVIEIINDTHLLDARLFEIKRTHKKEKAEIELFIGKMGIEVRE